MIHKFLNGFLVMIFYFDAWKCSRTREMLVVGRLSTMNRNFEWLADSSVEDTSLESIWREYFRAFLRQ
jgi:hypothetical protein